MKRLFLFLAVLAAVSHSQSEGGVIFSQPPSPAGGIIESAWYPPDGLDGDNYAWDSFQLDVSQGITEIRWRGGYTNFLYGAGESPVFDFTISIYASIGAGTQPDITAPPLVQYSTGDNAGETPAGTVGGVPMYDYHFILPSPFQAVAGTKYWLQIEASQGLTPFYSWPPDWGFSVGTGGNGTHFHAITGGTAGGGTLYQIRSGDLAFTLLGADSPTVAIVASASPANGGTVMGEGAYPVGSTATLQAAPNPGFGFVNWMENGTQVSNSAQYSFTATTNRTLVANFTAAYTITTSALLIYGGTTTGDGIYNSGSSVTVVATPRTGYVFTDWTEFGASVSTSPSYTLIAGIDRPLVANFAPGPLTVTFDLDSGTPLPVAQGTATPFNNTLSDVTAHFSSPQDAGPYHPAFSLQSDATLFYHQVHLTGNYFFPGTVYRNDLDILFSQPITSISLDFATAEYQFAADPPSPLVITAYHDSTSNPPVGSAQSAGQYLGTTFPEGYVTLSSATPFNLVHVTVGPNSWGTVDFLADNFTVIVACTTAGMATQPVPATACSAGSANFTVTTNGTGLFSYIWQRETSPNSNNFVDLADGPTGVWDGGGAGVGGVISGATTNSLMIAADTVNGRYLSAVHEIRYRCAISNGCSNVSSDPASLTVLTALAADVNGDSHVDGRDVQSFVNLLLSGGTISPAFCAADLNHNGAVNIADVPLMVTALITP